MVKAAVFLCLCLASMVTAGLFGALHNQISFTIGASYFYDVKFAQFGIASDLPPRIGAAMVGWMASWWMGLAMGLPAFVLGYIVVRGSRLFLATGLRCIVIALSLTALGAFCGLSYGYLADINSLVTLLPNVDAFSDPEGFIRAALMHDASYIGGAIGALAALWIMWNARPAALLAKQQRADT